MFRQIFIEKKLLDFFIKNETSRIRSFSFKNKRGNVETKEISEGVEVFYSSNKLTLKGKDKPYSYELSDINSITYFSLGGQEEKIDLRSKYLIVYLFVYFLKKIFSIKYTWVVLLILMLYGLLIFKLAVRYIKSEYHLLYSPFHLIDVGDFLTIEAEAIPSNFNGASRVRAIHMRCSKSILNGCMIVEINSYNGHIVSSLNFIDKKFMTSLWRNIILIKDDSNTVERHIEINKKEKKVVEKYIYPNGEVRISEFGSSFDQKGSYNRLRQSSLLRKFVHPFIDFLIY